MWEAQKFPYSYEHAKVPLHYLQSWPAGKEGTGHLVLVYESAASGGHCGLKSDNLKRMHAPPKTFVRLESPNADRFKRSTGPISKMIELAVFVDEILYGSTKKKGTADPIASIQDIVFTYINSVSASKTVKRKTDRETESQRECERKTEKELYEREGDR